MASITTSATTHLPSSSREDPRKCWICFGDDAESAGKRWVKPCQCSLISHEECLLKWISENQKGLTSKKVRCPQCQATYVLTERNSTLLQLMTRVDLAFQGAVPYLMVVGLTCSVVITGTTYGAYAVLTVCGAEEGEALLAGDWSWRTWIGLPLIPVLLVASRTPHMDVFMPLVPLLVLGRDHALTWPPTPALTMSLLPWARLFYNGVYAQLFGRPEKRWRQLLRGDQHDVGGFGAEGEHGWREELVERDRELAGEFQGGVEAREEDEHRDTEMRVFYGADLGRMIAGALLLPAIASTMGSFLGRFAFIRARTDTFHRNVIGGCLFVIAKDLSNLLYLYQRVRQRQSRHVKNYDEVVKERQGRRRRRVW
ncbi:uncharacterized protein VTP21DRAFT_7194 [Calcarisporiella thermophila]|uniref:uncharacterized protein n=1 Tax=Calcarisporiella thermophila TaxID=911321 RepID=UPI003744204C